MKKANFEGEKLNLIVSRVLCGWMVQSFRTVHRTDVAVPDEFMDQTALQQTGICEILQIIKNSLHRLLDNMQAG